jgi:hypothetical protein
MNVPPEIDLGEAIAQLEDIRTRLGAHRLLCEWRIPTGAVCIIVPGPHVMVEDQEVPLQRREAS